MIAFKTLHTSATPTNHAPFRTKRPTTNVKNNSTLLCLCKSNDSDSGDDSKQPQGDLRKQELLAKIAQLQTEKVRVTNYLDNTAAFLTKYAEEANAEFDKVGENALKELEQASSKILENIESQMQSFEESAELNRMEIERNDKKLADFESQMVKDQNEGMFFKNLGPQTPVNKAKAMEEAKKIKDLTKEKAGSKVRKNVYLALIGLVSFVIADSFISSPDWRKVAVLGAILVGLITQFSYEQKLSSDRERTEKEMTDKEKE